MKFLLLFSLLIAYQGAYALTLKSDFKIHCQGELLIKSATPFYTPTHCPGGNPLDPKYHCYRALPIPAQAGAKVAVEITKLGIGCYPLDKKYHMEIAQKDFETKFILNLPSKVSATELPYLLIGKTLPFSITQSYAHAFGETLPLYPQLIEETLIIKSHPTLGGQLSIALPVDSKKVYGITTFSEKNDEEKILLTKQIKGFIQDRADLGHGPSTRYSYLFRNLVPQSLGHLKEFADTILDIFSLHKSQRYGHGNFFRFHVGGSGGTNYAEALTQGLMKEDLYSSTELVDIYSSYPGLLNLYQARKLPMNSALIEDILQAHYENLKLSQKPYLSSLRTAHSLFQELSKNIEKPFLFHFLYKRTELITPKVKELAKKISDFKLEY